MKVNIARWLTLGSYLGLIVFNMVWAIWLADLTDDKIFFRLLFVSPLLFPLLGVLGLKEKVVVLGSLVCLIYAVDGGVSLWTSTGINQFYGGFEMLLALTYLFSSSYFLRWRAEANAAS